MDSADIKHFLNWLEIRERCGQDGGDALQLRCDADHSSLLRRLLKGKEPLPEPPPLAMSYPWYELIDEGRAEAFEVYLVGEDHGLFPAGTLIIEQSAWTVLETLGPDSWVATYRVPDEKEIQELRRKREWQNYKGIPKKLSDSRWKVYTPGPHPKIPERKQWIVERA